MPRLAREPLLATVLLAVASACSSPALEVDAGDGDGGRSDAGAVDGGHFDAGVATARPELYPADRRHSPITPYVAANLRTIAARASTSADVFVKVGDSITVDESFLHCFAGTNLDWDGREQLESSRAHFAGGTPEPFARTSLAAGIGWNAAEPLTHAPGLSEELIALTPGFAVVMYGTNDVGYHNIDWFGTNMLNLVDYLGAAGVVSILSTIPPRDDSASADAEVPRHNAVIRGIAQAYQLPLVDFHRELIDIPGHGLWGDGVHPNVYSGGGCIFTSVGLGYGHNLRNLITIEALARVVALVVDGGAAPDVASRSLEGQGTHADPFIISELPFADRNDTALSTQREVDSYSGCSAEQDESGPELVYRLDLASATTIRALVIDRGEVDIDIHLLAGGSSGAECLLRDHQVIVTSLAAGSYYLNLDSFVGEIEHSGEYLLVVMEEPT